MVASGAFDTTCLIGQHGAKVRGSRLFDAFSEGVLKLAIDCRLPSVTGIRRAFDAQNVGRRDAEKRRRLIPWLPPEAAKLNPSPTAGNLPIR